jgi:hypothetical protein
MLHLLERLSRINGDTPWVRTGARIQSGNSVSPTTARLFDNTLQISFIHLWFKALLRKHGQVLTEITNGE